MRFIFYGAGAVGGGTGALLAEQGHEVQLLARGKHLDRIQADGLMVRTPSGSRAVRVPATGHPSEIQFRPDDVIILTMKSQDTEAALRDLAACGATDLPILCAQNGVANEAMALRQFARVYGMLVIMPATMIEPGEVLLHGQPAAGILDGGCYPQGTDALITEVTGVLNSSGFDAQPRDRIMRWKYGKLVTNLRNALYALAGQNEQTAALARELGQEAAACYARAGIDAASREESEARRTNASAGEISGSPRSGTSTWQSLARASGSSEVDYLNGEIALLGRLHGVPTPVNRAVQELANRAARERWAPETCEMQTLLDAIERCRRAEA